MNQTPGTFPFVVLNDLHYMGPDDQPWLEGLIREVNGYKDMELALVLGDLAETGSYTELSAAKKILDQLRVPYYVVPGNHDGPEGRPERTTIGDPGLADYERLFPGRRNYVFEHNGWQFVAMDTTNGSGYQHLPTPPETRAFAAEVADKLDKQAPTIIFTHMPFDPRVKYSLSDGYELLQILSPLNLRIIFSGHYHGLSEYCAPGHEGLRMLTNRCSSRTRELHDNSNVRGYFRCVAFADGRVDYAFAAYAGAKA